MPRTTQKQIDGTANTLNEMLRKHGSSARVVTQGRNGYTGLDLCDAEWNVQKTLTAGTKSEVWNYMHAMMEALWLLESPYQQARREREDFHRRLA